MKQFSLRHGRTEQKVRRNIARNPPPSLGSNQQPCVPEEEATVHDAELRVEIHGLAARVNLGIERERDGGDHAVGRVPEVPDVAHLPEHA